MADISTSTTLNLPSAVSQNRNGLPRPTQASTDTGLLSQLKSVEGTQSTGLLSQLKGVEGTQSTGLLSQLTNTQSTGGTGLFGHTDANVAPQNVLRADARSEANGVRRTDSAQRADALDEAQSARRTNESDRAAAQEKVRTLDEQELERDQQLAADLEALETRRTEERTLADAQAGEAPPRGSLVDLYA